MATETTSPTDVMKKIIFLSAFFVLQLSAQGQGAVYNFCVATPGYNSFKAEVVFQAVDFGEGTAKNLLMAKVKPILGDSAVVKKFNHNTCQCQGECQVLVVTPEMDLKTDNLSEFSTTAACSIDKAVYEVREAFNDPKAFLGKAVREGFRSVSGLFD